MLLLRALLALIAVAGGPIHGAIREVVPRDIDAIFAPWDKAGSPGAALAVFRDGKIIYERGYGRANLEHDIPITPETVFYVGSVSKQFAAAAVSLLARQGKLGLDDHVRKYVPELPTYSDAITIRQLIHHTSGLRDYLELRGLAGEATDGVFGDADVLALIAKQKSLNFPPGSENLYSNSGYFLLSVIVKRVSGKTLRQFTAENIFEPLGMKSAQFRDDHARLIQKRADGYTPAANGFRLFNPNFDVVGAGGVFMSVRDFLAWDENFYQPKVGDQEWIAALQTPGKLNHGAAVTYAFGLVVRLFRGLRVIEHTGSYGGFRAYAVRFPEHHLSVVCFTNLATMSPSQLSIRVASLYLAGVMTSAPIQAATAAAGSSAAGAESTRPAPTNQAAPEIEGLIGSYYSEELEAAFHIGKDGNGLNLRRGSNPSQRLTVVGKDTFQLGGLELTFLRGDDNIAPEFRLDHGRVRGLIFKRR